MIESGVYVIILVLVVVIIVLLLVVLCLVRSYKRTLRQFSLRGCPVISKPSDSHIVSSNYHGSPRNPLSNRKF